MSLETPDSPYSDKNPKLMALPAETRESAVRRSILSLSAHIGFAVKYAAELRPSDLQLSGRLNSMRLEMRLLKDAIAFPATPPPTETRCTQCARKLIRHEPIMHDPVQRHFHCLSCHLTHFGQLTMEEQLKLAEIMRENALTGITAGLESPTE